VSAPESVEVKLTRLEAKFDALAGKVDDKSEVDRQIRTEIATVREQARHDASAVRVDLERQLHVLAESISKHEQAVNPHPNQEDWMRRHVDRLATAIDGLRNDIAAVREKATVDLLQALVPITTDLNQAKGAGRILWPALAAAIAAAGAFVAGRLFGG
jgi:chromosome segregation ATPase